LKEYENEFLEKACDFSNNGENPLALKFFKMALKTIDDKTLKITTLANIAQVYLNLGMFEDALEYCDEATKLDPYHFRAHYRKARALAFLDEFDHSEQIFDYLGEKDELKYIKKLEA
jgi:tetratricopeptide (TPR) repeat protein